MSKLSRTFRIGLALFMAVFTSNLVPAAQAFAADGDSGTLTAHEKGTSEPTATVCTFSFEASNLAASQTGTITIEDQSEVDPAQPVQISLTTDESGNGATEYINDADSAITLPNGNYKATADQVFSANEVAANQLFQVSCQSPSGKTTPSILKSVDCDEEAGNCTTPCTVTDQTLSSEWQFDGETFPDASDYSGITNNATYTFTNDGLDIATPGVDDTVFGLTDGGNTPLSDVDAMAYSTYRKAVSAGYAGTQPSYVLYVDTNGAAAGGETYFFYEPYNNSANAANEDVWQTWDTLDGGNAKWWMSGTGQALHPWNYFVSQFPDAVVLGYGFNLGTYNAETYAIVQDIQFDCATTHFTAPLRPVTPKAPIKIDFCYTDKDSIFIPHTRGVVYKIGEQTVRGGTIPFTGEDVEISAEAAEGYVLNEGTNSWTFTSEDFANNDCLKIEKAFKSYEDTNQNGTIDAGDSITWTVTVTNTSNTNIYGKFKVIVKDLDSVIAIAKLRAGESVERDVTTTLSNDDISACKATNTADFWGWRAHRTTRQPNAELVGRSLESLNMPIASGSATAEYNFTCPVQHTDPKPPKAPLAPDTGFAKLLPAASAHSTTPILALAVTVIAYGALYFAQPKRKINRYL